MTEHTDKEQETPVATLVSDNLEAGKKRTSSALEEGSQEESKFGSRLLVDENDVFAHNAWDHVDWDSDQEEIAKEKVALQLEHPVPEQEQAQYYSDPAEYWNKFYQKNENRFFKDRHWLKIEFPELFETSQEGAGKKRVFEIGCGAGNTMYPLLEASKNPELFVYAADYSKTAVDVVLGNKDYDPSRSCAFVWDLTSPNIPEQIEPESLDMIVLIFVLSALAPEQWNQAIKNIYKMLRPGGRVLFRDYGRYDLAQLRFKKNRLLKENFYIRGDGTRVYFFTPEEIAGLFQQDKEGKALFSIEQNAVDRRLIVNRQRKLKMYRVWLQGKFKKL
ncbi:S-adenosyl-L-methionine-dependent methyltransferase [Gilbertella persicaria]|uniref:S-adenosyl-L-methionine-dependent methyltransferase n=1 Tax=Gilbertella persicaria TaxID=101096 RepID=UPI0022205E1E|nr:S-adenosyl-L-methionine-dependent methyltransferase [Gilbertella persicaria]KAI8076677.1 S-adenosyl-L-methionine-dependent methyltransferase [Gilbertella persicaria]